ncbi:MAG: IS91 family transposase [Burkholderiales bacterium]|nr:IS91 family transposase [Burkholderiales bacterium]
MSATLAEVLRTFGPAYLRQHALSTAQARAWRAIVACRTPALGGKVQQCDQCGREQRLFHSCGNRHCPQCQSGARDAWRQAQLAELLPVPYCHLVFTLPHALNGLAQRHARWVYRTLMQCAAATLTEFAANPRWLGAMGAFTLVLHTWTQDLRRHVHVHALMACGGLDAQGRWCAPTRSPTFLFPVHALSRVFRGKFLDALRRASQAGELPVDPADTDAARQTRLKELARHDWVVYAKTPLAGPELVLDYLSRYTHRVAVSNERIVGIDAKGVRLRVRADDHGGKRTTVIDGETFIARFLQHVLPPGFKRIRHYGLLSAATKTERLAKAREALAMPAVNEQAREDAAAFIKRVAGIEISCCPHCRLGHWRTIEVLPASIGSRHHDAAHCRGPP